jgi:hypothetical protein
MLENQDYSNIGFRSETSIQELKKYSRRENPNPLIVEDAKKIVNTFYGIIEKKGKYDLEVENRRPYFKLLMEDFLEEERVISSVPIMKITQTTLEKMANKDANISPKEIEIAIAFFGKISTRCKEHSSKGSCH